MKTPILGSSYVARSVNAADSRMVNLYPEINADSGKEAAYLSRAPGLRLLKTIGTGPIRGLWSYNNYAFVVSGNELYRVDSNWIVQLKGTIIGSGPVSMADNGNQLFIACNGPSYIYNLALDTLAIISDLDFPGAQMVGYMDGYFVFTEPNSQRVWTTNLYDGTQIEPLDYASAEGSPDGLVSLIVDHRELWLFGTNSVEVWYDAGNIDFPFAPIQGAFNEIGCAASYSVAKMDNSVFWLGSDARGRGIVYKAEGYTGKRISTHAVEWQIQQYGNLSDAIGYTYQQDGHQFYVLVFPSADTTWVYDAATQAWHERASWEHGQYHRHRGNCQVSFNDEIIIGDYENGNVYAFDLNYYSDNGEPQRWMRSWRALPTGQNDLKRTAQHSLQLDCETGVGTGGGNPDEYFYLCTEGKSGADSEPIYDRLMSAIADRSGAIIYTRNTIAPAAEQQIITQSGDNIICYLTPGFSGYDPQVMLRWSDDGGHTWSNEHWRSMGKQGQYGYRTIWRRLGMTLKLRDRVYEIAGTDPVKIAINGAELLLSQTNA